MGRKVTVSPQTFLSQPWIPRQTLGNSLFHRNFLLTKTVTSQASHQNNSKITLKSESREEETQFADELKNNKTWQEVMFRHYEKDSRRHMSRAAGTQGMQFYDSTLSVNLEN